MSSSPPDPHSLSRLICFSYKNPEAPRLPASYGWGFKFVRWIVESAYSLWDYLRPGSVAKAPFIFEQVMQTAQAGASREYRPLIEHVVCHLTRTKVQEKEGSLYAKKTVEAIEKRGTSPLLSERVYSNYFFISQDPDLKRETKLYSFLPALLSNEECAKKMEELDQVARKRFYLAVAALTLDPLDSEELVSLVASLSSLASSHSSKEIARSPQQMVEQFCHRPLPKVSGQELIARALFQLRLLSVPESVQLIESVTPAEREELYLKGTALRIYECEPSSFRDLIEQFCRQVRPLSPGSEKPSISPKTSQEWFEQMREKLLPGAQLSFEEQESLRRIRRNLELNTTSAAKVDRLTPEASREFYLAAIALRLDPLEEPIFEKLALFLFDHLSQLSPDLPPSTTPKEALQLLGKQVCPQIEKESEEDQHYFYELLLPQLWRSIELPTSHFQPLFFHPYVYLRLVALRPSTEQREPLVRLAFKLAQFFMLKTDPTVEESLKSLWKMFKLSTLTFDSPLERQRAREALCAAISAFKDFLDCDKLPKALAKAKIEPHQERAFLEVVGKLNPPLYLNSESFSPIIFALVSDYLTALKEPLLGEELEQWLIKQRLEMRKRDWEGKGEVSSVWTQEFALFWYLAASEGCLSAMEDTTLSVEDQEQLLSVIRKSLSLSRERWWAFIREPEWHSFWSNLIQLDRYCRYIGSNSEPLSYRQAWNRLFSSAVPCPENLAPENLVHHLCEAFKKIEALEIPKEFHLRYAFREERRQ